MYNGQKPISIWLPALGTQQISHLTFYFHVSPWCPDYCGEKTNEINRISVPKEISYQNRVAREQKGYSKRGWLLTRHGWHVLSTLPCHPGTGNQFLWSTLLPYLCVSSVPLPQGQAAPQAMTQHGARAVGKHNQEHPLALQAGTHPYISISHPTPAPCFPPPPREWDATLPARLEGSTRITRICKSGTILQCGQLRGWQSQPLLTCGLMLLNQLCKSGQWLGKLYLPKTLAFQR